MELVISNVSKQYRGDVWALRDFSLRLGPGIVGLLGPNGAGKSTVMRIIATITRPTSGTIAWNGVDIARQPDSLRRVLGYLPQDFGVYPNLNAVEFLSYLAAVKGLERAQARRRIEELLQLVHRLLILGFAEAALIPLYRLNVILPTRNDRQANFEQLWQAMDRYYPQKADKTH